MGARAALSALFLAVLLLGSSLPGGAAAADLPPLLNYYPFEPPDLFKDYSGRGRDLFNPNNRAMPTLDLSGAAVEGRGCADFDNNAGWLNWDDVAQTWTAPTDDNNDVRPNGGSYALWIKPRRWRFDGVIEGFLRTSILLDSGGSMRFYYNSVSSLVQVDLDATDKWHHFAVVIYPGASSIIQLYVNGVLRLEDIADGDAMLAPGTRLSMGRWGGSQTRRLLNALVDDIRIYNGTLTAQQVKELYFPIPNLARSCRAGRCPTGAIRSTDATQLNDGDIFEDTGSVSACTLLEADAPGAATWAYIDMEEVKQVGFVKLHSRGDSQAERMDQFEIRVGNASVWDGNPVCHSANQDTNVVTYTNWAVCNGLGRYVFVVFYPQSINADICELEVYPPHTLQDFAPPLRRYRAGDWDAASGTLVDSGTLQQDSVTSVGVAKASGRGNGAREVIDYVYGSTASTLVWADDTIPDNFT
eukprot:3169523-Rhodomonas_salina.1